MDQALFPEFFLEPCAFQPDLYGRTKVVWVDNCSSHRITPRLTTVLTGKINNSEVPATLLHSSMSTS
jgi:hypothetical protein